MLRRAVFVVLAVGALLGGCDRNDAPSPTQPSAKPPRPAPSASASAARVTDAAAEATSAAPEPEPKPKACPEDMVLVEGNFCPAALQLCLEHHPEYVEDNNKSERCLRYQAPSKCVSKQRKPMRFCMDRYEWPNEVGKKPLVLVQWLEAKKQCESVGKRLCDEEEWLFACEGEKMLPHVYGYDRDPQKCQIDREYRPRTKSLKRYDDCMKDAECREHFEHLDQRKPIGSFPECVSPEGVFDLNGSVNEWVNIPGEKYPNRSGLKGGWWGPVRCRCRPTVRFHKEEDWGYEAGFRCCKEAKSKAPPKQKPASAPPQDAGAPDATGGTDAGQAQTVDARATTDSAPAQDSATAQPDAASPRDAAPSGRGGAPSSGDH